MSATRTIGVRREDKHEWERRVPLTPDAVAALVADPDLEVVVQPSPTRVFPDDAYAAAGATVAEDLSGCDVVFAVKEIPAGLLREGGAYVFFSHTIKGQAHNMPLLRRLMELGATLIDYERITDDAGRRLVFFGRFAGLAGMNDTLAVAGQRWQALGVDTPFASLKLAHQVDGLAGLNAQIDAAGAAIAAGGIPASLAPLVVGFAGYGNVSRGAQEVFDRLPHEDVAPADLEALVAGGGASDKAYKVVFKEADLVERRDGEPFVLQDYYDHPEGYRSTFAAQAARLSILVNAIYWTPRYPRLVDLDLLKAWAADPGASRLATIGDISCDIDGSVECTVRATTPNEAAYVYDATTGASPNGVEGPGIAMMTTDCLPCELPAGASSSFTEALSPYVAALAKTDWDAAFDAASLPDPIRRAVVLWRGEFTPDHAYMAKFLDGADA